MVPDINVLVAASRADHPHHAKARTWLEAAILECESGNGIEILPMVAAGFLRLVTNTRVFPNPTPIEHAIAFLDGLFAVPGVEVRECGSEWPTLRRLCLDGKLVGNAIPDAWIAAAVRSFGGRLVTFDRDFLRLLGKSELMILAAWWRQAPGISKEMDSKLGHHKFGHRPSLDWPPARSRLPYAEAEAAGLGAVNVDGVMVDAASVRILQNTLRKADLIGI